MADPVFDSIKVPDRTESTAKAIDNAAVPDASGATVHRQVTVTGSPTDHSLVAEVTDGAPASTAPGAVVRTTTEQELLDVQKGLLDDSRRQTRALVFILAALGSAVGIDELEG